MPRCALRAADARLPWTLAAGANPSSRAAWPADGSLPCLFVPWHDDAAASPRPQPHHTAEFVVREGADGVRHEQIVAAVKSAARQKVPDNLKAELLKR